MDCFPLGKLVVELVDKIVKIYYNSDTLELI